MVVSDSKEVQKADPANSTGCVDSVDDGAPNNNVEAQPRKLITSRTETNYTPVVDPPLISDKVLFRGRQGSYVRIDLKEKKRKVLQTLGSFRDLYDRLLHIWETQKQRKEERHRRAQLPSIAADELREKGLWINTGKTIGVVYGIEIGDSFEFRAEMSIIGLHIAYERGIDHVLNDNQTLATSIVVSKDSYMNYMESDEVLIYSGEGKRKIPGSDKFEDQKLEGGNLALSNSRESKTPVRVIYSSKFLLTRPSTSKLGKDKMKYFYDGLYRVTFMEHVKGQLGNLVYQYRLERIPGQPKIPLHFDMRKSVPASDCYKSSKNKTKPGKYPIIRDVSCGVESKPVSVYNAVDDARPPSFSYRKKMLYHHQWCLSAGGCSCCDVCRDRMECTCASKSSGGKIQFSNEGTLIDPFTESFIYECGFHCKCGLSCKNRVTQRGSRFEFHIFRTKSKGWALRARGYIPRGSFVCEYVGDLLEQKDAKETNLGVFTRVFSEDEKDCEMNLYIDASRYGNMARFIQPSSSPNLIAKQVFFDDAEGSFPHIMLFSLKNIHAHEELTLDYSLASSHSSRPEEQQLVIPSETSDKTGMTQKKQD